MVVPGPRDVGNRYKSVIKVFAREKVDKEANNPSLTGTLKDLAGSGECSGVLIDSRHAVTAGHCVCMVRPGPGRRPDQPRASSAGQPQFAAVLTRNKATRNHKIVAFIDSSECAKKARLETFIYDPPVPGEAPGVHEKEYFGTVTPHPEFEMLYDDSPQLVWSNADLAVITLDRPIKELPSFKLATREVRKDDHIVMVGYGPGDGEDAVYGKRHSGTNVVSRVWPLETGSAEFMASEQFLPDGGPASHVLGGDSGGGCLNREDGDTLVGITSSGAENLKGERVSIFTSVYAHLAWLEQQRSAP
ncbi:trypsin-like peptidase domain-containing protein [Hyalangium versicolor]|uniref:trypsin-like peptidase domain-containing protein n=1 Tax=Hyalangium versicolor TaxID=2861190 RepID=UPI0035A17949